MKHINIPTTNLGTYHIPETCIKKVCVDIGANIGDFTSSQLNNFELIHFYEPFKPCFDIVYEKTKNYSHVQGFNEAVYKQSNLQLSMIAHSNKDAGSNALKTDCINLDWDDELDLVNTVSFTDILTRANGYINYLKIDCETSEYYLLIDQDLTHVDYIGIELHWQMGEEKYNKLINHILKTHTCDGDFTYCIDTNKEVLFKNISL